MKMILTSDGWSIILAVLSAINVWLIFFQLAMQYKK